MAVVAGGREARTDYRVVGTYTSPATVSRLECRLETGRTHQIRVHFADAGSPVVGDPLYGRGARRPPLAELAAALGRQALHAAVLAFDHPITGEPLAFESSLPPDMQALVEALREVTSASR
jgi:23S rRNA pseudouridine1911/1915/1917 synthase